MREQRLAVEPARTARSRPLTPWRASAFSLARPTVAARRPAGHARRARMTFSALSTALGLTNTARSYSSRRSAAATSGARSSRSRISSTGKTIGSPPCRARSARRGARSVRPAASRRCAGPRGGRHSFERGEDLVGALRAQRRGERFADTFRRGRIAAHRAARDPLARPDWRRARAARARRPSARRTRASGTVQLPPSARLTARSARTQAAVAASCSGASAAHELRPAVAALDRERALPDGRQAHRPGASTARIRPPSPRRLSPATASTIASYSPRSSLASRVSTLPRSGRTSSPGKRLRSCASRRRLEVPTTAPARQLGEPRVAVRHERVARVLAREDRREREPRRQRPSARPSPSAPRCRRGRPRARSRAP